MGSSINHEDSEWAVNAPLHSGCTATRLDLTTSSASVTLAVGDFEVCLVADAGYAVCKVGGAASVPSSAAALAAGFALLPGVPRYVRMATGETALHAIMSTGTGTLVVTKLERRSA